MCEQDESAFNRFIADIKQKVEKARIIVTSKAASTDIVNLSGIKYSVTNLENKYTIQLLKKTLKDAKSLESFVELNEFLEILNGHPQSILLLACLENNGKE